MTVDGHMMHPHLAASWWPMSRLAEGVEEIARRAGLVQQSSDVLSLEGMATTEQIEDVGEWITWASERLGVESEEIETKISETRGLLLNAAPALLSLAGEEGPGFLLLLESSRGQVQLIGADLKLRECPVDSLRAALCWPYERPIVTEIERILEASGVSGERRATVMQAMLNERLSSKQLGHCWIFRLPASASFWGQLASARLPRRVFFMLCVFSALYSLEIIGWKVIGEASLNGRPDTGWLSAWLLLMFSMIPMRLLGGWLDATFALDAGRILKSRLLAGALRMDLESVKRQGVGHLLGRVMESQALETLAISGGLGVIVGILELAFAAWILWMGAGAGFQVALLLLWVGLMGVLAWRYFHALRKWTLTRLEMTHHLIEQMVGHRTRLAQEWSGRRDPKEDRMMSAYQQVSRQLDDQSVSVLAGIPNAWMIVGLAGIAPAFIHGQASPSLLAISLGGILMAQRALANISGGLAGLSRAAVAWEQVSPIFKSGHESVQRSPYLSMKQIEQHDVESGGQKMIDAQGLRFGYQDRGERVIDGVNLEIHHGERILLEGASGSGKSTLATLLTGLRQADSGLILLNGLDRHTLGERWHQLATEAPQFHENHVLSGSLAFNLLMGRDWPPTEADLQEAADLCEELGLGELLQRMPSGLMQRIGETGWQLSHGERSRIFLARALLQGAQLTVMDESFAALDPETLNQCLQCAMKHTDTMIVIAHP